MEMFLVLATLRELRFYTVVLERLGESGVSIFGIDTTLDIRCTSVAHDYRSSC